MKKIFAVIIVALVAMVFVFGKAVDGNVGYGEAKEGVATTGTTDISFQLTPAEIEASSVGFVNAQPTDLANNPKDVTTGMGTKVAKIVLTYKSKSNTAKNDSAVWYYYKVKALNAPTLTISGTALENTATKKINWTATVTNHSGTISGTIDTKDSKKITVTPDLANGFASGYGQLSLETQELDASYASGEDTYAGTIVFTVVAG